MITFYEHRAEILRSLENDGLIRQFSSTEDSVAIRLRDPEHLLVFGVNRMSLGGLSPSTDMEMLMAAAALVWEALAPPRVTSTRAAFQWLVPIEADYDEARIAAGAAVMGMPEGVSMDDFAMVIDGSTSDPDTTFHGNSGIVESAEIPARFSMTFGDVAGKPMPPHLWRPDELPDVALYCSQDFEVRDGVENVDGLFGVWRKTEAVSASIRGAFHEKLVQKGV